MAVATTTDRIVSANVFLDMGKICIQSRGTPWFEYILSDAKTLDLLMQYADKPVDQQNPRRTLAQIKGGAQVFVHVPLSALRNGNTLARGVSTRM